MIVTRACLSVAQKACWILAFAGLAACNSASNPPGKDGGVDGADDTGANEGAPPSEAGPEAGRDATVCVFDRDGSSFDKGCVFGP